MALRLVEMVCTDDRRSEVEELVKEFEPLEVWHDRMLEGRVMVKILLRAEKAEAVLDKLESAFSWDEGFRILLMSVDAALPHPKPQPDEARPPAGGAPPHATHRISRHEIMAEVANSTSIDRVFIMLVVLSGIVAAIGMRYNNVAVIIGAMVIAPLLGPNMAVAFATTIGDVALGRRALRTALTGIGVALLLAIMLGSVLEIGTDLKGMSELVRRCRVDLPDVILALAAGAVGGLAFTTGIHTPLVGVMVAVALLPPLVAWGLLLGSGHWPQAAGAMLLFLTNLICINLAGIVTFLAQGVRPRTWWEADKARRASRRALAFWIILLVALVAVILLSQRGPVR